MMSPARSRPLKRRYLVAAFVLSYVALAEGIWVTWQMGKAGLFSQGMTYPTMNPTQLQPGCLLATYNGTNFERPIGLLLLKNRLLRIPLNQSTLGAGCTPWEMSGRLTGRLMVKEPDEYRFLVMVNGGARAWIDGNPVVNFWPRMPMLGQPGNPYYLAPGPHRFVLEFSNSGGEGVLGLDWQGSHVARRALTADDFLPDTTPGGGKI